MRALHRLLIDEAMKLVGHGGLVTVAEVAAAAGVSRATAYRYFSRSRLIDEIMSETGPVRRFESSEADGAARCATCSSTFSSAVQAPERRRACSLRWSIGRWSAPGCWARRCSGAATASRSSRATRRRQGFGAREYDRLLKALSLVYGIEPYVVPGDMWGSSNREERDHVLVADAVIEKSPRVEAPDPGARVAARQLCEGQADGGRRRRFEACLPVTETAAPRSA